MDIAVNLTAAARELVVPLKQLIPSPKNARKTVNYRKNPPAALAASIKALGVLQNLVVTQAPDDQYFVDAGERRRQALLLLVKAKDIDLEYPVRCLLVPDAAATTVSLTENFQREAMHPADEFESFRLLIEEGRSVEDIAAEYGVTPLVVKRRLRLSNVSPRLLKAYRNNEASLDQLMALAITEDHKAQDRAFFSAPEWQRDPSALRARLTEADVEASDDPVVKFVTAEAYEAAGGTLRRDLFADEGAGVYLADRELLDRLAAEKLAALAGEVRGEGWSWVDVVVRTTSGEFYNWTRVPQSRRKPTPAEAKELDKLRKRQEQLGRKMEKYDDEDEAPAELHDELEQIAGRIEALQAGCLAFAKKYLEVSGAVVTVDRQGQATVLRGLVKDEDEKRLRALDKPKKAAAGGTEGDAEPAGPTLSEAFTRRLSAHRTMALQAELARQPHVALVTLVHKLVSDTLLEGYYGQFALQVSARPEGCLNRFAPELPAAPAAEALRGSREAWVERLTNGQEKLDSDTLFRELLALSQDELVCLLAACIAPCLNAVVARENDAVGNAVALALNLDMTQWWTATADSYFSQVSKARIVEAVGQFAPGQVQGLDGKKKAELAAEAEKLAAGSGWLPPILRRPD